MRIAVGCPRLSYGYFPCDLNRIPVQVIGRNVFAPRPTDQVWRRWPLAMFDDDQRARVNPAAAVAYATLGPYHRKSDGRMSRDRKLSMLRADDHLAMVSFMVSVR